MNEPQVKTEKPKRIQNPAARHIPEEFNVGQRCNELPWRVVGSKIMLMMMKNEERLHTVRDEDGSPLLGEDGKPKAIVLTSVKGHMGKDKARTYGLVLAFGAGEVTQGGCYISPEWDYGIYLGAVVMIDPESGTRVWDDSTEYRTITVWDVISVMHPEYGLKTYERLRTRAAVALSKYADNRDEVEFSHEPLTAAPRPSYETELGDVIENARVKRGAAIGTAFAVNGLKGGRDG